VMNVVLVERLKDVTYDAEDARRLCREIAKTIQDRVKLLGYPRYKLVTQVVIAEAAGQGLRVASRCLWDPEEDNYAAASYVTPSMICSAVMFGC